MELIIFILSGLLGVVFLSVVERKLLGIIQIRKGPKKVGYIGLLQSLADALKLFIKEKILFKENDSNIMNLMPAGMVLVILLIWLFYPMINMFISFELSMLLMICILSLDGYFLLFMGWLSVNKYALLGTFRGVSQMISYEIVFFLIILSYGIMMKSYSFSFIYFKQLNTLANLFFMLIYFLVFYFILLCELNRTPCDLVEGESELVSGFNVEYLAMGLSFIFIAEFLGIMISMLLFSIIMMSFMSYFMSLLMILGVLWIRAVFPRIRYDNLMMIVWKNILPMILSLFVVYFIL